jgi:flagellar hook-length control protein FliK
VTAATAANPTAASSAPAATPVVHQITHAIIAEQAHVTMEREHSFQMLLEPPELGRLFIQMSRGSRGLEVKISAEDEGVRSILQTSAGDLQQSLQLSNLSTGQFGASMQQHSEDAFRDMLQFDRAFVPTSHRSAGPTTPSGTSRSSGVNMVA